MIRDWVWRIYNRIIDWVERDHLHLRGRR